MVDPLSYFSFQPVLHDGCPVCEMVYIKEPLVLIRKSSPCGSSMFTFTLSGPLPYIRRHVTVNKKC